MQLKYVNRLTRDTIIELAGKINYQFLPKNDYWGTDIIVGEKSVTLNTWNGDYLNQGAFKLERLEFNDFEIISSSEKVTEKRNENFQNFIESLFSLKHEEDGVFQYTLEQYRLDKLEYDAKVKVSNNNKKIAKLKAENQQILKDYSNKKETFLKQIELKKQIESAKTELKHLEEQLEQ